MSMMVFVALSRGTVERIRAAGAQGCNGPWTGYMATAEMLRSHQLGPKDVEDAEYTALVYAGLRSLTDDGDPLRMVVAAEPDAAAVRPGRQLAEGEVTVSALRWDQLRALFVDERGAAAQVRAARERVDGTDLRATLNLAVVQDLIEDHDLLWHLPEELDRIPG